MQKQSATRKQSKKPAATKKPASWTALQRRQLTAICHPQPNDPQDAWYEADAAEAWLRELKSVNDEPMGGFFEAKPGAPLTMASERQRYAALMRNCSWSGTSFTDDRWNALIGLWVGRQGWDFVLDLLLPTAEQPLVTGLEPPKGLVRDADFSTWSGVRRYLRRATAEEFQKALERVEPLFTKLLNRYVREDSWDSATRDATIVACWLAFAFDRHPAWTTRILGILVESWQADQPSPSLPSGCLEILVSVNPDPKLSLRAARLKDGPRLQEVDGVYDLVETLGPAAVPVLEKFAPPREARHKKRLAGALALAQSLS